MDIHINYPARIKKIQDGMIKRVLGEWGQQAE